MMRSTNSKWIVAEGSYIIFLRNLKENKSPQIKSILLLKFQNEKATIAPFRLVRLKHRNRQK